MQELNDTNNQLRWISQKEACDLLLIKPKTLKNRCNNGEFIHKIKVVNRKREYFVRVDSLPETVTAKLLGEHKECSSSYADAPEWAKVQADKYIQIIKDIENKKGAQIKEIVQKWNSENPENKTTYSSVMRMKKRYQEEGIAGLLAKYKSRISDVPDEYFDYFRNLYLVEGSPSLKSCVDITFGYAKRNFDISKEKFPSPWSFKHRLEQEIPAQAIYLARNGQAAWNRKYGNYLERDYSNIICGKVWVSDHAQIDVACLTEEGNVVFPWVTAWRDYKSGKWLGWILQTGSPNSDLIFQSFYYSAEAYGLPEDVIIDNGKDYRCKDFAGGRKSIKVESNKSKTTSMLSELNVNVHFALPYNAQTKPIERDFLKIKELLSKHCVGYRGGNVVERPEKLADEIKKGKIMPFDKFKQLFDDFIINVLNKRPSQGKNLKGISPDELFYQELNL